jgi:hypothetical protein
MKPLLLIMLCISVMFACNNDAKTTVTTNEDGQVSETAHAGNMEADAAAMQQKVAALKKLEPLTVDQVKSVLPAELMGIKRSEINASGAMGFSMGEATYRENDSTYIKISVFDVAGEAGSGIYGMQYWGALNMQQEKTDGYVKTIDFKGDKAIEKFDENTHTYELLYMGNNRIMVNITGVNTTLQLVKQVSNRLHFDF